MKITLLTALAAPLALLWVFETADAQAAPPLSAAERQAVIASVIGEMNQRYVLPETAKQVEATLREQQARQAFDDAADGPALAQRLTDTLRSTAHDKHLRVLYREAPVPVRQQTDDRPTPEQWAEWRRDGEYGNYGIQRVERLPGNIGYLDLREFAPAALAGPSLAAAMTLLAHTDTLIVDLRKNGGGDPATVALVCSDLFDQRTHLNSLA